MAVVLSAGVIAVLCTIVITATLLIILYCVCRSGDPLLDHTCVAWLHSPRIAKKGKHTYDVLPLHELQNGHAKPPREDKFGTIEKIRLEEKKHKTKARKEFYERNPEKCPLSIDEQDFYRSESWVKDRREISSRDEKEHDKQHKQHRAAEYRTRSREYWEPKAKSIHDIYVNEKNYSQSRYTDYNIDKQADKRDHPSKSLSYIDKYDEQDGGGTTFPLYLHPRTLKRKDDSDHYVRPRSLERDERNEKDRRDSHHSLSHYVRPRSLERDERNEKDRRDSHHSSSHYVRPRSLERDERNEDRRDSHHSLSHYVRPRSLERDERNEKDRRDSHHSSSHYVRPRSLERDERNEKDRRDSHHSLSHYVRPRSLEREVNEERGSKRESHPYSSRDGRPQKRRGKDRSSVEEVTDSLYVNLRTPVKGGKGKENEKNKQDKQRARSKENTHSKDNYYQNVTLDDEQILTTPLLQSSEEIMMFEIQQLSSEVIPKNQIKHQPDRHRDRPNAEGKSCESERQSRPSLRSTEYTRTKSQSEIDDDTWGNHKKRGKENYFLPRTQSVKSDRPPRNIGSPIARRHTIHLEFHPRSGDVTPVENERKIEFRKLKNSMKQEHHPKERGRELSPRRMADKKKQDWTRVKQHINENTQDNKKYLKNDHRNKNVLESESDDKERFTIPPRYDSLVDKYRNIEQKPRLKTGETRDKPEEHLKHNEQQQQQQQQKVVGFLDDHKSRSEKSLPPSEDNNGTEEEWLENGQTNEPDLKKAYSRTQQTKDLITSSTMENEQDKNPKKTTSKAYDTTDGNKINQHTAENGGTKENDDKRFQVKEFTKENHPYVKPCKSTESTSSGATMESIHREIQSSAIYQITDDGRLVVRGSNQQDQDIPIQDLSQDKGTTQKTRVLPKRTKSMERMFYVTSLPRSAPTLVFEDSPVMSQDKRYTEWHLSTLINSDMELKKDENTTITQDTLVADREEVKTESSELVHVALPARVVNDKNNIDWHFFACTGKNDGLNNHSEEDGATKTVDQPTPDETKPKVTSDNNIDWQLFNISGQKLENKIPSQDKLVKHGDASMYMTNTTQSIRQSLETQIKFGEDLHTPSEDSLHRKPRIKPTILKFE